MCPERRADVPEGPSCGTTICGALGRPGPPVARKEATGCWSRVSPVARVGSARSCAAVRVGRGEMAPVWGTTADGGRDSRRTRCKK